MSRRYLITGAQGFVGRYLAARLLADDRGACVYGVGRSPRRDGAFTHAIRWGATRLAAPLPEALSRACAEPRYRYRSVDLHDRPGMSRLLRECRPDVVVHLASALRDDPVESLFRTNVVGTVCLMDALLDSGVGKPTLIIASTGGVYGDPPRDDLPLREDGPLRPVNPYSVSKVAMEYTSRTLSEFHGVPVIWARLFNLVGPGQDERHVCGRFASALAAVRDGEAPPHLRVGALETTRDFLDVRDAAHGLQVLAERGAAGTAYNLGSGIETSIDTVLRHTVDVAGLVGKVAIEETERRRRDVRWQVADVGRLGALGFRPRYELRRSIDDLFRYYADTVAGHARQEPRPAASYTLE
jgi:nucleoside-diphosphate-sugar epimerase